MAKQRRAQTYEEEALNVLVWEFSEDDHVESERKLKRRLREKKLGAFDAARIAVIRQLKNDVRMELDAPRKSTFYHKSESPFAKMEDWDVPGLQAHLARRYPALPESCIAGFLPYAIYLYYLR